MPARINFTSQMRDRVIDLRVNQKLSWDIVAGRLGVSREWVIKKARLLNMPAVSDAKRRRSPDPAPGSEPQPVPERDPTMRLALPAGHWLAMDVLMNAPRFEDRWAGEEE